MRRGHAGIQPQDSNAIWLKAQDAGRQTFLIPLWRPYLLSPLLYLVIIKFKWKVVTGNLKEVIVLAEVRITSPTPGERSWIGCVSVHLFTCFQKRSTFLTSFNYKGNSCSQHLCQKK